MQILIGNEKGDCAVAVLWEVLVCTLKVVMGCKDIQASSISTGGKIRKKHLKFVFLY